MNLDMISHWLGQHPDWILGCIFAMSMMESLAMIGLVTPGIAMLFVAGTAAGGAGMTYLSVLLAAYAGAVTGDLSSYFLGYKFHARIINMPPFRQHPEWMTKAEIFFQRYGLYGLFVGRFIGPLRPVLPMIAGALELPFWRFLALDLCSGPLWAAVYLSPGFLVGSATGAPIGAEQKLALFFGIVLTCALIMAELLRRFLSRERTDIGERRAALSVLVIACVFLMTLYLIVLSGVADPINRWLALEAISVHTAWADHLFVAITGLGERSPMMIWGSAVCVILLAQRAWWHSLVWVVATLSGNLLMHYMKLALAIDRPPLTQRVPDGYSFPSGHASMGLIFAGVLTLLIWQRLSGRGQRLALHAAALYVALVTASRLYLGVHWTSDLLAGWALGAAVIAAAWLLLQHAPRSLKPLFPPSSVSLYTITLAAWVGIGVTIIQPRLPESLEQYAPMATTADFIAPATDSSEKASSVAPPAPTNPL